MSTADTGLQPVTPNTAPGPEYATKTRLFQGIPGIERAPGGRLWATWYSGGDNEGPDNHALLVTSGDDGATWTEPVVVIDPPGTVRAFDPCLWHDPDGRLWFFWAQGESWFDGRSGVWAIMTEDSSVEKPTWSAPRRICNGIMMNKPTVTSKGEWLLPGAVWECKDPKQPELAGERFSNAICSTDHGATWERRGGADVPNRCFDEHMIVEKKDDTLWVLVRLYDGIGESFSSDGGRTWTPGRKTNLGGPNSRFFIRRLRSGKLLLVNHMNWDDPANPVPVAPKSSDDKSWAVRSHLTAMLSDDDGASWYGHLLLDERTGVSYPDGIQADDGRIHIIYDRNRRDDREILMTVFTEEDVAAGRLASEKSRLKAIINRAGS